MYISHAHQNCGLNGRRIPRFPQAQDRTDLLFPLPLLWGAQAHGVPGRGEAPHVMCTCRAKFFKELNCRTVIWTFCAPGTVFQRFDPRFFRKNQHESSTMSFPKKSCPVMCRFFFTPTDWGHGSVLCPKSFQGLRKEEKKGNRDTKKLSDPFQSLGRVWISPD